MRRSAVGEAVADLQLRAKKTFTFNTDCTYADAGLRKGTMVVSVVLVGCGAPLRSMGWYHATQLLNEEKNM